MPSDRPRPTTRQDEGAAGTAAALIPPEATLDDLADIAAGCTACHLHEHATQTVFGAGPVDARLVLVGEQPGDREDREGAPFVGPAGEELDRGLEATGIDRDEVYVTNVVKHFKFERKGKRRIHETPTRIEIDACLPWLRAEVQHLRPDLVLALGATAAKALLGPSFRVTRDHGVLHPGFDGSLLAATVHPSSILRVPDSSRRGAARQQFHDDLRVAATVLHDGVEAALLREPRDHVLAGAQRLDLPGRSSMDKATLARAVAAALTRGR